MRNIEEREKSKGKRWLPSPKSNLNPVKLSWNNEVWEKSFKSRPMGQESTVSAESSPCHIFFGTTIFLLATHDRQLPAQFEELARARKKEGLSAPCLAFAWRSRVEVTGEHLLVWS